MVYPGVFKIDFLLDEASQLGFHIFALLIRSQGSIRAQEIKIWRQKILFFEALSPLCPVGVVRPNHN